MTSTDIYDFFGEPIHVYTRADALRDGALHDLSELACEAGIRWPLAIATNAWADTIRWPDNLYGESERGRAWDVVWLASIAIRCARNSGGRRIGFSVARTTADDPIAHTVRLAIHVGPGDNGEPVLTITSPADE